MTKHCSDFSLIRDDPVNGCDLDSRRLQFVNNVAEDLLRIRAFARLQRPDGLPQKGSMIARVNRPEFPGASIFLRGWSPGEYVEEIFSRGLGGSGTPVPAACARVPLALGGDAVDCREDRLLAVTRGVPHGQDALPQLHSSKAHRDCTGSGGAA